MRFVLAALLVLAPGPAASLDYTCPSDPGFCYFDVGNDGCFDAGTDTGPIDLASGFQASGPGSIVCPPSVTDLTVPFVSWSTEPDGDVLIHAARIRTNSSASASAIVSSGGRLYLGGDLLQTKNGFTRLTSRDDMILGGKLSANAGARLESTAGDIEVTKPKSRISCPNGCTLKASGDIVLAERVQILSQAEFGDVTLLAGGDVTLDAPRFKARFKVEIQGANVDATGMLFATAATGSFHLEASGDLRVDQLSVKSGADELAEIVGGSVEIGRPDAGGAVRTSRISGAPLTVDATGPIQFQRLIANRLSSVDLVTTDTTIELLSSLMKGSTNSPMPVTLTAGAGSTCDVSGTAFNAAPLTLNCDTVIGP